MPAANGCKGLARALVTSHVRGLSQHDALYWSCRNGLGCFRCLRSSFLANPLSCDNPIKGGRIEMSVSWDLMGWLTIEFGQ